MSSCPPDEVRRNRGSEPRSGHVRMVDVTEKPVVYREAVAEGFLHLRPETLERILRGEVRKGDVITVSKVAAILAAKQTPQLIPLCHPIPITHVETEIVPDREKSGVFVRVRVRTRAQTGCEMEALVACATALLTVWDMVKEYEKDEKGQYPDTWVEYIRVVEKVKVEG